MTARLLLVCFTALLYASGRVSAAPAGDGGKPNIIFILADDLGYGDLGCYGQKQIQTPNLDRLAGQGMRFTNFYAGSTVCAPSRAVLMTGLHTGHAPIRGNAKANLRPEDVTVAEVLKKAGYYTGHVGKWGLGHEGSTGLPTRKGFDEFFGVLDHTHAHNYYPTFLLRGDAPGNERRVPLKNVVPDEGRVGQGVASERKEYAPDLFTQEALRFVDRNKERPFFLYLAYTLPHANNEARQKGMEVPDYGIYQNRDWPEPQKGLAAMISRLDRDIGQLMERLKQNGLDERTIVIFSSDNGPHREGGNDPDFFDSNGPLRGIKRDLYEGGIRVPMIVRWPGRVAAGTVSSHIGSFTDVLPTLAEVGGGTAPKGDGLSFVPVLQGKAAAQKPHPHLYWEFYERGGAQAVRMDKWKGVCRPFGGPLELYDLEADPGETRNIADRHPEIVARLREIVRKEHTPSPLWKVKPAPAASPEPAVGSVL